MLLNFNFTEEMFSSIIVICLDKIESRNVLTRVLRDHRADNEMLHILPELVLPQDGLQPKERSQLL